MNNYYLLHYYFKAVIILKPNSCRKHFSAEFTIQLTKHHSWWLPDVCVLPVLFDTTLHYFKCFCKFVVNFSSDSFLYHVTQIFDDWQHVSRSCSLVDRTLNVNDYFTFHNGLVYVSAGIDWKWKNRYCLPFLSGYTAKNCNVIGRCQQIWHDTFLIRTSKPRCQTTSVFL